MCGVMKEGMRKERKVPLWRRNKQGGGLDDEASRERMRREMKGQAGACDVDGNGGGILMIT